MKRYAFPLTIILLLITVVALAAPGDKRPAVTSAAIGLGTSSSPTLASVTATTSVTAPAYNSTAADGYHYVRPYNSIAFAGTPLAGMFVTTPTGPQWYTGSEWEAIGGDSLPSQAGNSGKYLTTNGTTASWGTIAAGSGIAISADIPTETGAANLNDTTHVLTIASSTGYTQFTGSFTAWDTTPNAFSFTDETGIAVSTAKISDTKTVTGINWPAAISVTGDTGYGYSKNSAACTATSGTINNGDTFAACLASSASNSTTTTATVTIGGVSDTYSVTTVAGGCTTIGATAGNSYASGTGVGTSSASYYNGIFVNSAQTSHTACSVSWYVRTVTGSVSGKVFTTRIYSSSGTSLGTLKGTSEQLSGSSISAGTWVNFTFSSPVTIAATDIVVITMSEVDGTNYISLGSNASDTDSGYAHQAQWTSAGLIQGEQTGRDTGYRIYE